MKIRAVGAELFHADGRTDMTKLVAISQICERAKDQWDPHRTHRLCGEAKTFLVSEYVVYIITAGHSMTSPTLEVWLSVFLRKLSNDKLNSPLWESNIKSVTMKVKYNDVNGIGPVPVSQRCKAVRLLAMRVLIPPGS